jgi:hypothetical protein
MKKNITTALCAIIAVFTLTLASCSKTGTILTPPPVLPRIVQLKGQIATVDYADSVIISYNSKGYPISLVQTIISTGYPQVLLEYDNKDRLIALVGAYRNGNPYYEYAKKYTFDNNNKVIADSMFTFGTYIAGDPSSIKGTPSRVTDYFYDSQNRIIKTIGKWASVPVADTTLYIYNAQGNKINSWNGGILTYDNKINPHRLHPVWQFIDRDYSNNNPFIASTYNIYGLPTNITASQKDPLTFLLFNFTQLEIEYR